MNSNFQNLHYKQKYRVETYCRIAFNNLKVNMDEWFIHRGCKDTVRAITHSFYNTVHSLSVPSGLISVEAVEKKKINPQWALCKDHCYSPQFIGRMIMDNPDKYLKNYSNFESIFWDSCKTILVTQEENLSLAALTDNDGDDYKIYVPTNKKYNHLDINLHFRPNKSGRWSETVPLDTNIIDTPKDLLEYERQYIVTSIPDNDITFCYESRKIDY